MVSSNPPALKRNTPIFFGGLPPPTASCIHSGVVQQPSGSDPSDPSPSTPTPPKKNGVIPFGLVREPSAADTPATPTPPPTSAPPETKKNGYIPFVIGGPPATYTSPYGNPGSSTVPVTYSFDQNGSANLMDIDSFVPSSQGVVGSRLNNCYNSPVGSINNSFIPELHGNQGFMACSSFRQQVQQCQPNLSRQFQQTPIPNPQNFNQSYGNIAKSQEQYDFLPRRPTFQEVHPHSFFAMDSWRKMYLTLPWAEEAYDNYHLLDPTYTTEFIYPDHAPMNEKTSKPGDIFYDWHTPGTVYKYPTLADHEPSRYLMTVCAARNIIMWEPMNTTSPAVIETWSGYCPLDLFVKFSSFLKPEEKARFFDPWVVPHGSSDFVRGMVTRKVHQAPHDPPPVASLSILRYRPENTPASLPKNSWLQLEENDLPNFIPGGVYRRPGYPFVNFPVPVIQAVQPTDSGCCLMAQYTEPNWNRLVESSGSSVSDLISRFLAGSSIFNWAALC